MTLREVDELHQRPEGTARKRFNDNRKHFIEGEDFFVRNTDEAKTEFGITAPNGLILLTESGYLLLVKSFTDDLAWQVQRQLIKQYFRAKEFFKNPPLPEYQDERIRAGIEMFRSVDVNSMKATGQVALFNTIGKLFTGQVSTTTQPMGQNPFVNNATPVVTETSMFRKADAEKALTWLREAYAKYGDELGLVQKEWFLMQRSHWKRWAKQNQLNLTLVLKELHNQGIVRKFYGSGGRYSYPARIDGLRVSAVWINMKLSGLAGIKPNSKAADDDNTSTDESLDEGM